ncbi:hypothetical protein IWQ61_010407, partial [Dispira simplex]
MTEMAPNVGGCAAEKWPTFDPEDVESFLDEFEKQADKHDKIGKRRCTKLKECLPPDVASKVIFFRGYEGGDWEVLKGSLRKAYLQKPVAKTVYQRKLDELTGKVKERAIIDKQIVPLTKLIEIVLDEAQNAQIWTDAERTAMMHVDQNEALKAETRKMEVPRAEPKSEVTRLMEELAKLTLLVKGIRLVMGTYEVEGDESDEEEEIEKNHEGGGFGLDPELKTILTQVNEMELRVRLGELAQISPMLRKGVLSLLKPKKMVGSKASVRKAHSMEVSLGEELEQSVAVYGVYKPVSKKVRPVDAQLQGVEVLEFPKRKDTESRTEAEVTDCVAHLTISNGNLMMVEERYVRDQLQEVHQAFVWEDHELGCLNLEVEPPIKVHMVPHTPWQDKPFLRPHELEERVIGMLKEKLEQG